MARPEKKERKSRRDDLEQQLAALKAELETRDRAVAQLQAQMKDLKDASMATVADYKRRFEEMRLANVRANDDRYGAVKQARQEVADLKEREKELNERLGKRIKELQEDLHQQRECNAQTLAVASGANGWRDVEAASVAVQMVKDLRRDCEEYKRFFDEVRAMEEADAARAREAAAAESGAAQPADVSPAAGDQVPL